MLSTHDTVGSFGLIDFCNGSCERKGWAPLPYNLLSFNLSASSLFFLQLFIGWQKYNIRLAAFLANVHMRWFGYDKAVLAPEVAMG